MKKIFFVVLLGLVLLTQVREVRSDDSAPPVERVSMRQARSTAIRKVPGKIRDFEFIQRKNKWVYAFKIAGKDQRLHHVIVDALTGKIVFKTSEPIPAVKKAAAESAAKKQ